MATVPDTHLLQTIHAKTAYRSVNAKVARFVNEVSSFTFAPSLVLAA